jgi:hypothetical protein
MCVTYFRHVLVMCVTHVKFTGPNLSLIASE